MVTVYSTCPPSGILTPGEYRRHICEVARWTESAGCRGLLVYSDNSLIDPWAAAQFMIERTETLVPMVAVQPAYMSPFTAARTISSVGHLYGRQLDLNLVAGGFAKHLQALNCPLDHDQRYDRLVEYGAIIRELLTSDKPVSTSGVHYRLDMAAISPPLPPELTPRFFVSGASAACKSAQRSLGAVRLAYPHWVDDYVDDPQELRGTGLRVGVIARDTTQAAWQLAHDRFPVDRKGEFRHNFAARTVESQWHRRLSEDAKRSSEPRGAYWLYPFRRYKTFCPYLVGTHEEVAGLLARYLALGVETIILDMPETPDDLEHAQRAIAIAAAHGQPGIPVGREDLGVVCS